MSPLINEPRFTIIALGMKQEDDEATSSDLILPLPSGGLLNFALEYSLFL